MEETIATELEYVACNLCGAMLAEPFARRQGMQIVRCCQCNLVYVNPRHNVRTLHNHYNSGQSSRIQYYLDVECADRRTFADILEVAGRWLRHQGRLLDIGPNIGTCLEVARE